MLFDRAFLWFYIENAEKHTDTIPRRTLVVEKIKENQCEITLLKDYTNNARKKMKEIKI